MVPTPLVIGELLASLGLPKTVVLLAMGGLTLYHGRSLFKFLSKAGFVLQILGGVAFLGFVAWLGLIPGISIDVAVGKVLGLLSGILGWLTSLLEVMV